MHALFWLLMNKALPHAMMLSHKCGGACRSMHSLYKARRTRPREKYLSCLTFFASKGRFLQIAGEMLLSY